MENYNRKNEIQVNDYKSLKTSQNILLAIRYLGVLGILLSQLLLDCIANYFLSSIMFLFLVSIIFRELSISKQLSRINRFYSDDSYSNSMRDREFQEMKYYEIKTLRRLRYFRIIENYIWILVSILIMLYKLKYAC